MNFDRDTLRKTAEHRRNTSAPEKIIVWPCNYCARSFQTENGFMNHHCKDREKLTELQSPRGQAAYSFYSEWMRIKKRSVPAKDRFLNSRQYNYFLKFVDWAEKTAVPNPAQFVKIMVQNEIEPVLWCRDTTYAMYLQWYDNMYPPRDQFLETLTALELQAEEFGVKLSEVYSAIGASSIAKLVRRRKLSPWLLTLSPIFLSWVQALPAAEKELIGDAVNFGAFAMKIRENPELAKELRAACEYANV